MNDRSGTDLQRVGAWLATEVHVRVSRKILLAAGVVFLVVAIVALD
jgi:hypothetical protein